MNDEIMGKVHRFGKIGKIIMTVIIVFAIIITLAISAITAVACLIPEEAVNVSVSGNIRASAKGEIFNSLWDELVEGLSLAAGEGGYSIPEDIDISSLPDDVDISSLPEGTDVFYFVKDNAEFSFSVTDEGVRVNVSVSDTELNEMELYSDGDKIYMDTSTKYFTFTIKHIIVGLATALVYAVSIIVIMFIARNLFKGFQKCDSPFSDNILKKMRVFSISLLCGAVLTSVAQSFANSFIYPSDGVHICIAWGMVIAFAVAACLCTVFRYGAQLQKESDETL
ncbi:MAG: DUF2975 domain-containing protein [Eubacteriales bacterium]